MSRQRDLREKIIYSTDHAKTKEWANYLANDLRKAEAQLAKANSTGVSLTRKHLDLQAQLEAVRDLFRYSRSEGDGLKIYDTAVEAELGAQLLQMVDELEAQVNEEQDAGMEMLERMTKTEQKVKVLEAQLAEKSIRILELESCNKGEVASNHRLIARNLELEVQLEAVQKAVRYADDNLLRDHIKAAIGEDKP